MGLSWQFFGKFIFLLLHLIHKELVLFIKEQLDDKDVFDFSHKVVHRFLVVIIKKCSRQSDVLRDLGLNIDEFGRSSGGLLFRNRFD